ncbi:DUF6059 family protein [Streptomyces sp. 4F14]|uniref:DUF6059 family protein n=1 Tax=Streptomyces sp. 4F14 TaxID=3394380 RepID=UPI003A83FE36
MRELVRSVQIMGALALGMSPEVLDEQPDPPQPPPAPGPGLPGPGHPERHVPHVPLSPEEWSVWSRLW